MKIAKLLLLTIAISIGAFAQTQHGITLNWTNVGSPTSNSVYSSTTGGGPYTKIATISPAAQTYFVPVTNTNSGIKTFFVVTDLNSFGESGFSNEVSATFPVLPQSPTGLSAQSQ